MSNRKITGNWSIPNGNNYPGQLNVDSDAGQILLEIYSSEYLDGSKIDFTNDKVPHYLEFVWGNGPQIGLITLYQCDWCGSFTIGENLYLTKYQATFQFLGLHISNTENLLVKSGKFSFPHLGSFFIGSESMLFANSVFDKSLINHLFEETISITDELELEFNSFVSQSILDMGISYKIEKYEYLTFRYKKEVQFSTLLQDAVTFRKLLSFSYGKPTIHKIHSVEISNLHLANLIPTVTNQDSSTFFVTNFAMNDNKEIPRDTSHQNHMLISKWKMSKVDLHSAIVKWFQNQELYNIYEYYLDSNNWFQNTQNARLSNVMFNNRFLNLIQGLEDFFRENFESVKTQKDRQLFESQKKKVLNLISDPSLKKWLNDTFTTPQYAKLEEKLATIAKQCFPVIHQAFGAVNWDVFPNSAKNYRNQLSHGMNKETSLGERFHLDYQMAQMLLCICILKSLELKEISKIIALNHKLQRNMYEILHLQKIYPS